MQYAKLGQEACSCKVYSILYCTQEWYCSSRTLKAEVRVRNRLSHRQDTSILFNVLSEFIDVSHRREQTSDATALGLLLLKSRKADASVLSQSFEDPAIPTDNSV